MPGCDIVVTTRLLARSLIERLAVPRSPSDCGTGPSGDAAHRYSDRIGRARASPSLRVSMTALEVAMHRKLQSLLLKLAHIQALIDREQTSAPSWITLSRLKILR